MRNNCKTLDIRFNSKGQLLIPIQLRKEFEIEPGIRVLVYREEDTIVLKPITLRYIKSLRGSSKGSGLLKSLMNSRKRERGL